MDYKSFLKLMAAGAVGLWMGKKYQEVKFTKDLLAHFDEESISDPNKIIIRGYDKEGEKLNEDWKRLSREKIDRIEQLHPDVAKHFQMFLTPVTRMNRLNKFIIDNTEADLVTTIRQLEEKYGNLYETQEAYTDFLSALNCYPIKDEIL